MTIMKDKILITSSFPEDLVEKMKEFADVETYQTCGFSLMPREMVLERLSDVTVILNAAELKIDEELLSLAPNLKLVANVAIGADNYNPKQLEEYGIWATNTPAFFAEPVTEIVIGGMIAFARPIREGGDFIKAGKWENFEPGRWDGEGLASKVLGIIGYGKIGHSLANVARALQMRILFYDPSGNEADPEYRDFETVISESDYLSVHTPLTDETRGMFNAELFNKMKDGAVFINAARGPIVKEKDLVAALQCKKLKGAIMDTFETEPALSSELLLMDNVIVTPHMGGGTYWSRRRSRETAVENVIAVLKGMAPPNALNNAGRVK